MSSGPIQQKGINIGAKETGKIAAGIYLQGNTLATTVVGGGWARFVSTPLFQLDPVQPVSAPLTTGINDYFELLNAAGPAETQALWYRYGKRASLYCSYSLTMFEPDDIGLLMQIRVRSINPITAVITDYPQSLRTRHLGILSHQLPIEHVFPLVAPSEDAFYIEINGGAQTYVVTVAEAYLSLGE